MTQASMMKVTVVLLMILGGLAVNGWAIDGDVNGDLEVNTVDLVQLAGQWKSDGSGTANFDNDADVDLNDFNVLAKNWLKDGYQLIINEFMAANKKTLADGNGAYPDWIELYNGGDRAVNLKGWYLTDDADNLTQWPLPDISLESKGYRIVFASGREDAEYPYKDSLGYYHTNFKLDADGEYVALVKPAGRVASTYEIYTLPDGTVGYPPQYNDTSYGLAGAITTETTLVAESAAKKVLVPTATVNEAWKGGSSFVDSAWASSTLVTGKSGGVGFDTATTYVPYISYDVKTAMYTRNGTCYIRIPFTVSEPQSFMGLTLKVRYDDGFIAYLNGTEIGSANKPATPVWNSTASGQHDDSLAMTWVTYDATSYIGSLKAGENILALQGMNYTASGSDYLISVELRGVQETGQAEPAPMYFGTPTPGKRNFSGFIQYVEPVQFSCKRGFYTTPFQVGLTCDDEKAVIRYTTDGTEPTMSNGITYTGWITISKTTCLRAMAWRAEAGWLQSPVMTQTYFFVADVVAQSTTPPAGWPTAAVNGQVFDYGMDPDITTTDTRYAGKVDDALLALPSISLVTAPANLFNASTGIYVNAQQDGYEWERPVSVELIYPDGTEGFQIDAGLRVRGGMSRQSSNPKHSFRLFFRSEYGASKLEYPLFGDEGADSFNKIDLRTAQNFSWNLGGSQQTTFLYDTFTRDTHRDMGQPYSRGRFYHLYIDGIYWGIYQTDERLDANYGESYFGGSDSDYDAIKADNDNGTIYATDGNLTAYYQFWTNVKAGVATNSAYFALQGMNSDGTRNAALTRMLDVDNLIDYMLAVFYAGNRDMPLGPPGGDKQPRNLFVVYNRANPDGFKYIAHDSEQTLITAGLSIDRTNITLGATLTTQANFNPWWLHLQLKNNSEYKLKFADHVYKYFSSNGVLTPDACVKRWQARAVELDMAIIAESARWGDAKTTRPRTRDDDWLYAINLNINSYFKASPQTRSAIVLAQLKTAGLYPQVNAPVFSQIGGQVSSGYSLTMTAAAGSIYYTTDGTDPRVAGGSVAASAKLYSAAVTIDRSMIVSARVESGSVWSALVRATFQAGAPGSLKMVEIMYHSKDESDSGLTDYVELKNTGSSDLNLNLIRLAGGIDFTFSDRTLGPNAMILVVKNQAAFAARYGSGLMVAGVYEGQLDNGGEEIVLQDALGQTLQQIDYEDGWYPITDGEGYSLTAVNPLTADSLVWSRKAQWRPSVHRWGSPGTDDAAEAHLPGDVVINEVMGGAGAWIELHNTTTGDIDISGWYLSDSDGSDEELMKYPIAGDRVLTEGEYRVFYFDVAGGSLVLSENGGELFLSSARDAGGYLTGYRDEVYYDPIASGVSIGRHTMSTGEVDFVALSSATPGAQNSYPLVGQVVISEIMYHPSWLTGSSFNNDEFEYIELYNRGTASVKLFDTVRNAPWSITNGFDWTFSATAPVTLPGLGRILIVGNVPAFVARHPSVPAGIIYGPYDGKLKNDGETIQLSQPGALDEGLRLAIGVDRVRYSDGSHPDNGSVDPWPVLPDGQGYSLIRIQADGYGSDPASWQAGTPSPGW